MRTLREFFRCWLDIEPLILLRLRPIEGRLTKFADAKITAEAVGDINTRLFHMSRRMDDTEALLKRVHAHVSLYHKV